VTILADVLLGRLSAALRRRRSAAAEVSAAPADTPTEVAHPAKPADMPTEVGQPINANPAEDALKPT
jgi:hypothetical protein